MPNNQIKSLTFDGTTYDIVDETSGYSTVSIDRKVSTGVNIAVITINGTKTELYAPTGGGGSVESVAISNATNGGLTVSGSPITSSGTISVGHSNVLTSAQTTQAVYPIKIDKNGHISEYGSAVTIPVLPANIVNTITTTAGAHSTLSSATGDVSFNIPTKVSHLDNDSGFVTTDEKLKTTALSSGTSYLIMGGTSGTAETKQHSTHLSFTSTRTFSIGSSGNKGTLRLYSSTSSSYTDLSNSATAARTITIPDATGTLALTSDIPSVPTTASSATTGISIGDHSTSTIYGVTSSTTSVTGVKSTTTTASKVTLGTAISVPNVTAAGSGSFTQGSFSGGSFTQGEDSFTPNIPTAIDTTKFSGGSFSSGTFNGGSFSSGTFTAGSLVFAMDTTDTKQLNITFKAPSHGADSFTAATHGADSFTPASLASGFYSAGFAASFTQGVDSFTPATHGTDTHVHTPPTIGTAISVPNVTGATDVTVPVKADSATTVPIKDSSSTTVVTSKTHTVTDNGHTHSLS